MGYSLRNAGNPKHYSKFRVQGASLFAGKEEWKMTWKLLFRVRGLPCGTLLVNSSKG